MNGPRVPVVRRRVPRAETALLHATALLLVLLANASPAASRDRGQELYGALCANCHGERGAPVWPGTPDFKRSAALMKPDAQLLAVIRRGKGVMPAYAGVIKDRELPDLLAYLRTMN